MATATGVDDVEIVEEINRGQQSGGQWCSANDQSNDHELATGNEGLQHGQSNVCITTTAASTPYTLASHPDLPTRSLARVSFMARADSKMGVRLLTTCSMLDSRRVNVSVLVGTPGTQRCWEQNTSQIQLLRHFEEGRTL